MHRRTKRQRTGLRPEGLCTTKKPKIFDLEEHSISPLTTPPSGDRGAPPFTLSCHSKASLPCPIRTVKCTRDLDNGNRQ